MSKNLFWRKMWTFIRPRIAPFVAGGALFTFIYAIILGVGPTPDPNAPSQVAEFRKWYAFRRGHGVWYDIKEYRDFIDSFDKLIKDADNPNQNHTDPKYKWVIGFYWQKKKDSIDSKVKYSYCMIPTLVVDNKTVIDYYKDAEEDPANQHYNHKYDKNPVRNGLKNDPNNAYDNGQLWP